MRVRQTPQAVRVSVALHPETDVQQVYDAFETGPDEHFLGSGERGDGVDLRGQILQIKVAEPCTYAAVPFFASSAGWGVRLDTDRVAAFAFPGTDGGTGCQLGEHPAVRLPAARGPRRGLRHRRAARRGALRRLVPADAEGLRGATRAARASRRRRSSS